MFSLNLQDKTYRVDFLYTNKNTNNGVRKVTECIVANDEERNKLFVGTAFCSTSDNFNKNLGRKLALSRAIKQFTREQRKLFWDKYFDVRGKKC